MLVVAHVFLAPGLMTVVFLVGVMVVSVILLFQTFSREPPPYTPPPQ